MNTLHCHNGITQIVADHIERCHTRHKKVACDYKVHTERNKVQLVLCGRVGGDFAHWTGLLEWTTGLTKKITFTAYNKIPFPVELHPALDQSVMVSHCMEPHTS